MFTANGSNTVFTLSSVPGNKAALLVSIDGVRQQTDAYSYSANTLTFSEAPASGAVIEAVNMGSRADVIITDGVYRKSQFTATAGQTTFNISTGYTVGFVDVYLNGIRLVVADDFVATDGSNIVLALAAALGDSVEVVAYGTFNVANALQKSGDTMSGNLVISGTTSHVGTASFSNTVTVANSGVTFADASVQTTAASGFGFKNRIINGAMMIDQRYSGGGPNSITGGSYSVDRWHHYYSGPSYSTRQSSTAPAGFSNSLLMTNTGASSTPTYCFFGQKIEGLNVADLNWGSADAATVTVSFWTRSSIAGIYSISVTNNAGDRSYPIQYTINAPNTWEYKTITVPGDTTGTWTKDNTAGIHLRFNLGSGPSRLAPSGSWQAGNYDGATTSTGSSSWANALGATFYITGVQVERGSTATGFDYRPYGTELALCQRYTVGYSGGAGYRIGWGFSYSATAGYCLFNLPATMRTAPSIEGTASLLAFNDAIAQYITTVAPTINSAQENFVSITATGASGMTAFRPAQVYFANASSKLILSSEL
jgi:hypothetical protein